MGMKPESGHSTQNKQQICYAILLLVPEVRREKKARMVYNFVVVREKEHESTEPYTYLQKK